MSILKQYDVYKAWCKTFSYNSVDNSFGISVDNLVNSSVDSSVDNSVDSLVGNSVVNSVDNSLNTLEDNSIDNSKISCGNYVMTSKFKTFRICFGSSLILIDLICLVYGSPEYLFGIKLGHTLSSRGRFFH